MKSQFPAISNYFLGWGADIHRHMSPIPYALIHKLLCGFCYTAVISMGLEESQNEGGKVPPDASLLLMGFQKIAQV